GGTPGYTYSWSPSGGTGATASGLAANTYTVTVTDANGCTATRPFTITAPSAIITTAVSQTNVSCNGGTNGSATVSASGGTPGYTYSWAPSGGTAATASGLAGNTYTVTVTDANGCTATRPFTITAPSAITATISSTTTACSSNTGTATVVASGGTPGYTYSWAPSGGTAATASGLGAGSYTCTITDANGCVITKTTSVTTPSGPTLTAAAQTNVSCNAGNNGAASVNAATGGTGPYTYNWTPGNPTGDGTVSVTGLTAGTWTCTVTDANGCTSLVTFTITAPSAIVTTAVSQTNVSCNGGTNGSATVSASGGTPGYTYSWAPSGGTAATASGLAANTYTVTVTDANGCTATRPFTITAPPAITTTAVSQTNVSCNGGTNGSATVSASGGTPGYTYSWAPSGGTAATASGLAANTYTVTVTDANGCTATRPFTITAPSAITSSIVSQTNVSCHGGTNGAATITASGGTGPYTYNWTPGNPTGDGTVSVTGLTAGVWTCTITDANGCTKTQTVTITEPTTLTATSTFTNVTCFGSCNGTATVTASGGTAPYTYSWTPSGGTGATASSLCAGTYTCTITDSHGCTATPTVTITQPLALSATATFTGVTCFGLCNGTATVTASGGTGPYTYSWSPSGGTAATASSLCAGTYVCTITDSHGCTTTQTVMITQPVALSATATFTSVTCFGLCNGTATVTASGGTGPYTYSWSPSGGTGATATGLCAGTYTCTITDSHGCTATQTVTIIQPVALSATATFTNVTCFGLCNGSVTVTVSGGTGPYTYSWSPSGGTGATATGLCAGTYVCTITDSHGCTTTQTVTIIQPAALSATATFTNVTCFGSCNGTASITASGGTAPYTYSWLPSGGTTATATGLCAGTYVCTITDANGCTTTQTITITEPAAITGSQTLTVCAGGSVTVGTSTYNTTGTFTDVLTAFNTCDSTVITNLTVLPANTTSQTLTVCAGGSVTVGTSTYNTTGTYTDVLTAFNTCDSTVTTNLTVLPANTTSQTLTVCAGGSVTVGTNTYNTSGTFTDVLTGFNTCDSTVTTILTVNAPIDVTTSVAGNVITANSSTGTYQWLDCNSAMAPIAGETNQSFTALSNGDFAVQVTDNGCVDTSACVNITGSGLSTSLSGETWNVYPNPTSGTFNLVITNTSFKELMISIVDIQGKEVYNYDDKNISANYSKQISLENLAKGIYYLKLNTGSQIVIKKLIIN
ncbi:MAG: T9SS type A sorting domain-containing protein, partial [Bacteroidia bacterium]